MNMFYSLLNRAVLYLEKHQGNERLVQNAIVIRCCDVRRVGKAVACKGHCPPIARRTEELYSRPRTNHGVRGILHVVGSIEL